MNTLHLKLLATESLVACFYVNCMCFLPKNRDKLNRQSKSFIMKLKLLCTLLLGLLTAYCVAAQPVTATYSNGDNLTAVEAYDTDSSPNSMSVTLPTETPWINNDRITVTDYDDEVVAACSLPTIALTHTDVSNPATITGLTAETSYSNFYAKGDSTPTNHSAFTEPVNASANYVTAIAPYIQSFDTAAIPNGWFTGAPTGGPWVVGANTFWNTTRCATAATDRTGNSGFFAGLDMSGTDTTVILTMEPVDVSALTTPFLRMYHWMCTTGYAPANEVYVEANTAAGWTLIGLINTGDSAWQETGFNLSTFTVNDVVNIRFRAESGGSGDDFYGDIGLDDISIIEAPACPNPALVSAANITDVSADLTFVDNTTQMSVTVEYGQVGFTPGTGIILTNQTSPVSIAGLTPLTDYEFYVTSACGADLSDQIGPVAFSTACQAVNVPDYIETFNTFVPDCWEEAGFGAPTIGIGPFDLGSGSWDAAGFGNNGTTGAVKIRFNSSVDTEWLLSPVLDLSAGGYELLVDIAVTDTGNSNPIEGATAGGPGTMGSDDQVQLLYTVNGGFTWLNLETWDAGNTPSTAGDRVNVDLSAITSSVVRFAFWANEGTVDDTAAQPDYDFFVDNFVVRTPPACPDISGLVVNSVTPTTANITFVSGNAASAGSFQYYAVLTGGSAPDATTAASGALQDPSFTGNMPTITTDIGTGVAPNGPAFSEDTTYDLYVRELCGAAGMGNWSIAPVTFTTAEFCVDPIGVNTFNLTDVSAEVFWRNDGPSVVSSVEYGAPGFTPGSGTTVVGEADGASLTGLTAVTTYDIYVTQDCSAYGNGLSDTVGPVSFTTLPTMPSGVTCTTGTDTILFSEDFAEAGGWTGDFGTGSRVWRFGETGTTGSSNTGPSDAQDSGGSYLYFETSTGTSNTGSIVSPLIDLSAATEDVELSFWMHAYGVNIGTFEVRLSSTTNFTTSPVAFTWTGQLQTDELSPWNQIGIDATAFVGGDLYVQFTYTFDENYSGPGFEYESDFSVDELAVNACSTSFCGDINTLFVNAETEDSITVSWIDNSAPASTDWEVVAVPEGDPIPAVGTTNATSTIFTVTGLAPNTDYDVYVRPGCSTAFVPFITSRTDCPSVFTSPYLEDFEGFTATQGFDSERCWTDTSATAYDWAIDIFGGTITPNTGPSSAFSGTTFLYVEATDGSGGDVATILSPSVSLIGLTNPGISFYYHAYGLGVTDFTVDVSSDGGITFTNGLTITGQQQFANANPWIRQTVDLSNYLNQTIIVRFQTTKSTGANPFQGDLSIDDFAISNLPAYVWDGTSWNNAPEGASTAADDVLVMAGSPAVLSADISANNITIMDGGSLDVDGNNVLVSGDLSNDGTVLGDGSVSMSGSAAQTITGDGTIDNLISNSAVSVNVDGPQVIIKQLTAAQGQLNTNGNLTFRSDASGTAVVGPVGATASIIGNVNVERYIPAGNRAYRFIGSTVSGPTVFDSWQEAGNNASGFGVQVTGTTGTAGNFNATTGLDETASGANSMFKWDASNQAWVPVTNTKTEILNAGEYYRLFVRGDRTTDLSNNAAIPTATTLRATGTLMTGSMTVTPGIAIGEFFALANPFQSKVSMASTATGTGADMYYWDPNLGTKGNYTSIDIANGTGTAGAATNVLDAGQAVFFQAASGATSVTLNEANKVAGNNNAVVFSTSPLTQALRLKLYQTSRFNNGQSESDGLYIDFDTTHNLNVDVNDATKLNGLNTNIAIAKTTGELLAKERRSLPTDTETINLSLTNYLTTAYTIDATVDVLPGLTAYLRDNFTGTMTELVQGTSTAVNFTVDMNDAQSLDASRFEIVFQTVTLSNDNVAFGANLSVHPNPVTGDTITINLGNATVENASVKVFNTLGQQVITQEFDNPSNGTLEIDNLSGLRNGVYIMNISNGDATTTRRFIKK